MKSQKAFFIIWLDLSGLVILRCFAEAHEGNMGGYVRPNCLVIFCRCAAKLYGDVLPRYMKAIWVGTFNPVFRRSSAEVVDGNPAAMFGPMFQRLSTGVRECNLSGQWRPRFLAIFCRSHLAGGVRLRCYLADKLWKQSGWRCSLRFFADVLPAIPGTRYGWMRSAKFRCDFLPN